jgi:hypothetical protein
MVLGKDSSEISYGDVTTESTGSRSKPQWRKVICPFDKYEITIVLTTDGEFVGIAEVGLRQDFVSYKQKVTPQGYHDVTDLYRE